MSAPYIEEGRVKIHGAKIVGKVSTSAGSEPTKAGADTLFYNPAQVFNRDLSLLVAKVHAQQRVQEAFDKFDRAGTKRYISEEAQGLTFCEPLAASCLRSLRYALELPPSLYRSGVAGDISEAAVTGGIANAALNGVDEATLKILRADANELMFAGQYVCGQKKWDVVDVDPYGTVAPFVDAAVRAVSPGGLLCITSTDMPVLGGNAPEVAFYKYGGNTLKARYLHELSLRLVIHSVQMAAAKLRRYAEPILSCSVDFYVRIWFRMHNQPIRCSSIGAETALILQCTQCDWFVTVPFGGVACESKNTARNKKRRMSKNREAPSSPPSAVDGVVTQTESAAAEDDSTTSPAEQVDSTKEITPEEATSATAGEAEEPEALPHKASGERLPRVSTYRGHRDAQSQKFVVGRVGSDVGGHRCGWCGSAVAVGGPCYAGPLQDYNFVRQILAEVEKSESGFPPSPLTADTASAGVTPSETVEAGPEPKIGQHGSLDFAQEGAASAWVEARRAAFEKDKRHHVLTHLSPAVRPKIKGLLTAMLDEESVAHVPLYYKLNSLCNSAHISLMKADIFRSALLNMGYQVGIFHREPQAMKTDAPAQVVLEILKAWIQADIKKGFNPSRVPPQYLTAPQEDMPKIDFEYSAQLQKAKGPRFLPNPQPHWGPGRRAGK